MINIMVVRRESNFSSASSNDKTSGLTEVDFPNSEIISCEIVVFAWSTTTRGIRLSSSPLGTPPANKNIKIIGRIMKNNHSDGLAKRIITSFHTMANIFFIVNSFRSSKKRSRSTPKERQVRGRFSFLRQILFAEQQSRNQKQETAHRQQGKYRRGKKR